ncbi:hypothetical protein C8Q77DRAFT_245643 [Trametes polyzona]|nr:hypothetical protein C8Q77DRAFT_245643 [Trametes polyzona]
MLLVTTGGCKMSVTHPDPNLARALLSELRGPNVLCPQDLKLQKGSGKTLAELHSTAKSGTIVYLAKEMSLSLVVHNAPDCPRRNFTFRTDHPAQIHGETSATAGPDGVLRTASRKPLSMRKWTSHLFFRLPNQAEQQAIQQMLSITNASFAPI